jgi:eukaryotic-like serine/threonine-protein kinase
MRIVRPCRGATKTPRPGYSAAVTSPSIQPPTDDYSRFAAALAGQYELGNEIGRGGMGIVYVARDLKLDRAVAIKTLPPHLANDPIIRERFLREARTAAALSHPNIVPIHRADELDGHVFFVMGLVDGQSLAEHVRDQQRVPVREMVRELRDVAEALDYAHSRGVIHRDIKAENILIDRLTGRAMVTDFGIARLTEAAPLTATGQLLGTVYYLSPEHISGEAMDGRSDIYSLGVAGFFALCGRFPFDGRLASAVIVAHVTKPAPSLAAFAPDVPASLVAIIDRCLAKEPANRFQTGAEMAAALAKVDVDAQAIVVERKARISDDEARAVWERAAQLQAQTGIVPRPAAVPAKRDSAKDLARTSGFQLDDIRAAALEAGIPAEYVEHALAERGLAPASDAPVRATEIVDRSTPRAWLRPPRAQLEFEVVLNGEVAQADFDVLGDIIQRTIGEMGSMSAVGRSLTWQAAGDRRHLQVTIFARRGTTTIRASENLRRTIVGSFGPTMAMGGGAMGSGLFGSLMAHHMPVAMALGLWGTMIAASFGVATLIFRSVSKTRHEKLRSLVDRLAGEVAESIEERRQKQLP